MLPRHPHHLPRAVLGTAVPVVELKGVREGEVKVVLQLVLIEDSLRKVVKAAGIGLALLPSPLDG